MLFVSATSEEKMTMKFVELEGQNQAHTPGKVKKMQITRTRIMRFGLPLFGLCLQKGYFRGKVNHEIRRP
jgi:hypothetical protein